MGREKETEMNELKQAIKELNGKSKSIYLLIKKKEVDGIREYLSKKYSYSRLSWEFISCFNQTEMCILRLYVSFYCGW